MARKYGTYENSQDSTLDEDEYTASSCLRKVEDAVKWRKNARYDETWAKLIKLYGNQYDYPELNGYEDVIAPNMLFSTVNVIVPSISVSYPKITVNARQMINDERAAVVEAVANYTWQYTNVHDEFRLAVKDFVIFGHGWCKTTWSFQEAEVEWTDQTYMDEAQKRLMELEQSLMQAEASGMDVSDYPTADDVVAAIPSKQTVVKEDAPIVTRVSPFDMFIDPDATRLKNARWIAERTYVPIAKARAREDWSPKARKQLPRRAMSDAKRDIDITFEGEERGKDNGFAVVWEYYDLIDGTVCTFAEGVDTFLSKPEPVPFSFAHPYVMLANYDIPDKLYPMGDVEVVAPLQMELALTRTQMVNDRKKYRRMYMYRPDDIGAEGVVELLGSNDNALIKVDSDKPFNEMLAPVATTMLTPESYNQTEMILEDINLVSGVSEYQRGQMSEIRRTATEAGLIQDGANARSAEKLSIIERAIGSVAEKIVALAQQFMTVESVARVSGPDGAAQWVQYTKEDLAGEWDFQVEAGSTMPQNESTRRQSAMQLMEAMAPFMTPDMATGLPIIDPRKMAEYVLKNGFGIKSPGEFMSEIPPMGMPPPGAANPADGMNTVPGQPGIQGTEQQAQGAVAPPPM